jgi:dephospho-CoA kinase
MKLKPQYIRLSQDQRLYKISTPLIGLTGGIATGKTTVARLLEQAGFAIISADKLVKDVYAQPEALDYLRQNHPEVITAAGIDFPKLREKVFQNPKVKVDIEQFIYQRLPAAFSESQKSLPQDKPIVYDVPLLFEKAMAPLFDLTVVVYAPREVQRQRLMQRDGSSPELADKILDHQMDIELKRGRADFVINNSSDEENLAKEVESFLRQVTI